MESIDLAVAAIPAIVIGAAGLWWWSRPAKSAEVVTQPVAQASPMTWPGNALPILDADKIIATTGMAPTLIEVRRLSGLTDPTWQTHIAPTIRAVAEMLQQLPASEAHHHAQPGGLFVHTVETLQHAAKLRQGRILPPGADIENQGRTQHLWTVGIYVAALLHDIGKTVADVRVTLFSQATTSGVPWQALMGSMIDAKAEAYVVDFPRTLERDYQAHQRIGIQLMQRLVSTETRIWLSSDPVLLDHLLAYLGGDSQGPIAEIARESEAESVRRNLASGSRVRFATSKATPLIELLMHGLRAMLVEGGRLPLNRPGAAGFCDGTDIWFAAARIANEVRDWLKSAYPDAAIPGETMNDRLFDTWQEYGACRVNPDTQGAIWGAQIEFTSGQSITLGALLRFPLELLYPEASLYPGPLDGRVIPTSKVSALTAEIAPRPAPAQPADSPTSVTGSATPPSTPPGGLGSNDRTLAQIPPSRAPEPAAKPEVSPSDLTPRLPNIQGFGGAKKAIQKPPKAAPAPVNPPVVVSAPSAQDATDEFLDDFDAAGPLPTMIGRSPPAAPSPPSEAPMLSGAVVPHVSLPKEATPPKKSGKKGAAPSDTAMRFMGWVQQGLADGSLPYNTTTALVHFVMVNLRDREETMMLLVSPAIFRRFAESYGDPGNDPGSAGESQEVTANKLGMGIQLSFTHAGWHQPATRGRNIHRFQVIRRGDCGGSLLNGFLVVEPERFVNPVPPANDRLRYWSQGALASADRPEKPEKAVAKA